MALKNVYARIVLRLIGSSLRLAARDQGAAKSIGWTLGKGGRLSIIQTEQQAASLELDMTTLISDSVRQVIASERRQGGVLWRMANQQGPAAVARSSDPAQTQTAGSAQPDRC